MKGHIRQRGRNWAIVLDHHDAITGQRKRRWYSFAGTKREAQVRCAQLIAELQSGASVDPNKLTVREFLDRFDRDWIATHVSAHSRERYRFALDHVRRHLGDKPLQKLRPADLAMFYATLAREGLAPRTIKLIHGVLHRGLGQAKTWAIIRDNPAELAKPAKAPDRETFMLQPDQAAVLLERLCRQPLYLIASLALGTGMRRNVLDRQPLAWAPNNLAAGASCGSAAPALAQPARAAPRNGPREGARERPRASEPERDHEGLAGGYGGHRHAGNYPTQPAPYPCVYVDRLRPGYPDHLPPAWAQLAHDHP
jgi:integrase family protein with SAM-like domain